MQLASARKARLPTHACWLKRWLLHTTPLGAKRIIDKQAATGGLGCISGVLCAPLDCLGWQRQRGRGKKGRFLVLDTLVSSGVELTLGVTYTTFGDLWPLLCSWIPFPSRDAGLTLTGTVEL